MYTEKLLMSDYMVITTTQSKIDKEKTLSKITGLRCPHCKKVGPRIEHGEKYICSCGLHIQVLGNQLTCSIMESQL